MDIIKLTYRSEGIYKMQGKIFEIKDQVFRPIGTCAEGPTFSSLSLFHRPYYTDDQIPKNHKFDLEIVGNEKTFWGKDILVEGCEIDGRGIGEGLKISFGYNIMIRNCIIHGGFEDCVDIVRGANIYFVGCKFISHNTKHHFTIKGGCKNIQIENCEFINDFNKWYDGAILDIGNYCNYDQNISRPKVRHVKVKDCRLTNIKFKLLARVLYGKKPKVIETDGNIFKVPSYITKIFFKLRNAGKLGPVTNIDIKDKLIYDIEEI